MTSTQEETELFSRGGSVPLIVENEEEAPVKSKEELKIRFHRTPKGHWASGDMRGKFPYELVKLPHNKYPWNFIHSKKKHQKSSGNSGTSSKVAPVVKIPVKPVKSKTITPRKALPTTPTETPLAKDTKVGEDPVKGKQSDHDPEQAHNKSEVSDISSAKPETTLVLPSPIQPVGRVCGVVG